MFIEDREPHPLFFFIPLLLILVALVLIATSTSLPWFRWHRDSDECTINKGLRTELNLFDMYPLDYVEHSIKDYHHITESDADEIRSILRITIAILISLFLVAFIIVLYSIRSSCFFWALVFPPLIIVIFPGRCICICAMSGIRRMDAVMTTYGSCTWHFDGLAWEGPMILGAGVFIELIASGVDILAKLIARTSIPDMISLPSVPYLSSLDITDWNLIGCLVYCVAGLVATFVSILYFDLAWQNAICVGVYWPFALALMILMAWLEKFH